MYIKLTNKYKFIGQWLSKTAMSVDLPVFDGGLCQRMFGIKTMKNRMCAGYIYQGKGICKVGLCLPLRQTYLLLIKSSIKSTLTEKVSV